MSYYFIIGVNIIMSRARLFFKGLKNYKFPDDFDDILTYLFFSKINEFRESNDEFKDFEYYTFSDFVIENYHENKNSFVCIDGIVSVVISSINNVFLKEFIGFLLTEDTLQFGHNELRLYKFVFLDDVKFKSESDFITCTPICLENFKGKLNLFSSLEKNLKKDYRKYHNLTKCRLYCEIKTNGDQFQKYVDLNPKTEYDDHYYILDLHISGDNELISFAYDCGLGNKKYQGFGMLDLY